MMSDDALRDAVATAISGAPFPSVASRSKAERILSTLRASGRLAPEVEGDVVEAAYLKVRDATLGLPLSTGILYEAIKIAAPIIAAATEARIMAQHNAQLRALNDQLAKIDTDLAANVERCTR